ncbi:isopentenyl-diphosphate Delta-isomerase [Humidisolicoccus flavus]|uniref:isopentenyl-diphosphate Delta-isomerase n=1 Tax=Humidisolicoccus flavus TaxID=3111414 RepID=UPI00324F6370
MTEETHGEDHVVLLDESRTPIGIAPKSSVHSHDTPLHLAFSCHVYNEQGQVLVTRRALSKRTWPGVWTNSFCGHPRPDELLIDAVARRAAFELGITLENVTEVLPDFAYRAVDASGIVEHEWCPVYTATTRDIPAPNPDEVAEFEWADPLALAATAKAAPFVLSPWLVSQLEALEQQEGTAE